MIQELMLQIIKGNVHLNEHGLIPKAYFELINKCTKWIPQIRTSLPDIKRALEKKEGGMFFVFFSFIMICVKT